MLDGPRHGESLTDVDLERALVALVCADNGNLDKLGDLQGDDLTDPIASTALALAITKAEDGEPVNLVTLRAGIEGIRDATGLSATEALAKFSIGGALPSVRDIAKRLKLLSRRRDLRARLSGLLQDVADERAPIGAIAAELATISDEYLSTGHQEQATAFHPFVAAEPFIESLRHAGTGVEISTGLIGLDRTLGGWHRGEFSILAGRPSQGKSTVALASLLRTAMKGHGVLFFSLEMTRDQVLARMLADLAYTRQQPLAYADFKPGKVDERALYRLEQAREALRDLPIEVETKNGLTMAEITARVRKAKEQFKARNQDLMLVVLDHLLKIRPSKRYAGNPVAEITEVSESCCVLAKSLNVAVVGLHQLNRQVENRDNERPVMSDLRGSGALEQDADNILFVYRPAYTIERQIQEGDKGVAQRDMLEALKHVLEIQVGKQRNGPTPGLKFYIDTRANVVRDVEYGR